MYTDIHAVFLYIKRERSVEVLWFCASLRPAGRWMQHCTWGWPQPPAKGTASAEPWVAAAVPEGMHHTSKAFVYSQFAPVWCKKRKESKFAWKISSAPAIEAKLKFVNTLPPQPVFLAGFGNYGHREANEIWRQFLSLIVTTAAEGGWGALLFGSLAARHAHHFASALHDHAKSHEVAQVHSVQCSLIKAMPKKYR